jgi:glucose-6-phosphate 1-dehydrogenase
MDNKYIDHIQITVAEQVTVGNRGGYYDNSGALRDMIQNHLLQLFCIIAMDCPLAYHAELIRDAKTKVLKSVRPFSAKEIFKNVVRAQYVAGSIIIYLFPIIGERTKYHLDHLQKPLQLVKMYC